MGTTVKGSPGERKPAAEPRSRQETPPGCDVIPSSEIDPELVTAYVEWCCCCRKPGGRDEA